MDESLHHFPCEFAIKIFGIASDEFEIHALTIIRKHFPDLKEGAIQSRKSKDGKYLALTITVQLANREKADEIYQELTASPYVLMAL
jgi:hypothetical protein